MSCVKSKKHALLLLLLFFNSMSAGVCVPPFSNVFSHLTKSVENELQLLYHCYDVNNIYNYGWLNLMNILKDLNVIHRLSISRSEKKIPDQSAARSFFPAEPVRSDESIFFFGSDST